MPPVPLPPCVASAPLPVTVKLPLVLVSTIPFVPPLAEIRVSETARGVVLLARVISTATLLVVVMLPLVAVIVWVLFVASRPRCAASGVMVREPKVIAPVFVVRLTPVPPDPVAEVLAKPRVALEVLMLMPMPVGFVTVVEPVDKLPATVVSEMPVVALFVDDKLPRVAASVPVDRFSVWPLPFRVTSEMLSVPKALPLTSVVAFPPVNPRRVLFEPTLIPTPALVMLTIGAPGFVVGKGSLPAGGVTPEIAERVAVASCPINF